MGEVRGDGRRRWSVEVVVIEVSSKSVARKNASLVVCGSAAWSFTMTVAPDVLRQRGRLRESNRFRLPRNTSTLSSGCCRRCCRRARSSASCDAHPSHSGVPPPHSSPIHKRYIPPSGGTSGEAVLYGICLSAAALAASAVAATLPRATLPVVGAELVRPRRARRPPRALLCQNASAAPGNDLGRPPPQHLELGGSKKESGCQ